MTKLKIGGLVEVARNRKQSADGFQVGNYRGTLESFINGKKAIVNVELRELNGCGFYFCKPFKVEALLKDLSPLNLKINA